jgi:RNA polymerase primary sigma factor
MKDLKELIKTGKSQGYINHLDLQDHLPFDIVDKEQIEDFIQMLKEMGIEVKKEKAEVINFNPNKNLPDN